jgi:hypothetical protein
MQLVGRDQRAKLRSQDYVAKARERGILNSPRTVQLPFSMTAARWRACPPPLHFHDVRAPTFGWDIEMFRDGFWPLRARMAPRLVAFGMSMAMIVTLIEPVPAAARPAGLHPAATGTATDFSAARRRGHYRRHYGRRYGPGPGLAMMGMMIGAIGAIANAERRREYYEDAPVAYAPQPYYGPQPYQPYYDNGYAPDYYGYAPQPAYPVAPVYAAPAYRGGPGFVPHVHANPQVNIARVAPRFIPQGQWHRHH